MECVQRPDHDCPDHDFHGRADGKEHELPARICGTLRLGCPTVQGLGIHLSTSILYYNDYDSIDEDARGLYRKAMAAFGGIAPSYHIELLDKPTIYWDFHSLLLGIQMMFSFMLVDDDQPPAPV